MIEPDGARIHTALSDPSIGADRLCAICLELIPGVDSASVVVIGSPVAHATVSADGYQASALPDLQLTLGQGPFLDAHRDRRPVLAPDVRDNVHRLRWPAFVAASLALGVRALFAFPMRIGAMHVGVLSLHRREPGPLTETELSDALIFAEAATLLILDRSAPGGNRAPRLRVDHHAAVHQATGIIMAQLDVSVEEAFVRLRAYTYVDGRTLDAVSDDVVARRIRFDVEEAK